MKIRHSGVLLSIKLKYSVMFYWFPRWGQFNSAEVQVPKIKLCSTVPKIEGTVVEKHFLTLLYFVLPPPPPSIVASLNLWIRVIMRFQNWMTFELVKEVLEIRIINLKLGSED